MQDLTHMYYDQYYIELLAEGKGLEEPWMYTVAKGTPIPSHLILLHEYASCFTLQPSRGTPLDG